MLPQQKDLVKATVPALQQHGEAITQAFYKTLFEDHPALLNIFNPANQQSGGRRGAWLHRSSLMRRISIISINSAVW